MIYNIREYTREDTSAMRSLWSDAFDDPSELIDFFFELLPSMGTGFVAELDGEIFGAAYVLDAFLHLPGGETKKLAYIYAVSVDEKNAESKSNTTQMAIVDQGSKNHHSK